MATASGTPIEWDRILVVGTDHLWVLRRTTQDHVPIIPTNVHAQIRSATNGDLWVECSITVDATEGWIYIRIPVDATADAVWRQRKMGKWDLEAVSNGLKERWVYGDVVVSQETTLS